MIAFRDNYLHLQHKIKSSNYCLLKYLGTDKIFSFIRASSLQRKPNISQFCNFILRFFDDSTNNAQKKRRNIKINLQWVHLSAFTRISLASQTGIWAKSHEQRIVKKNLSMDRKFCWNISTSAVLRNCY